MGQGEGWKAEDGQSRLGSGYLEYPESVYLKHVDLGMAWVESKTNSIAADLQGKEFGVVSCTSNVYWDKTDL